MCHVNIDFIDVDECQIFGFCEQTCFNIESSYKCTCVDGYHLENGFSKHCKADYVGEFSV